MLRETSVFELVLELIAIDAVVVFPTYEDHQVIVAVLVASVC